MSTLEITCNGCGNPVTEKQQAAVRNLHKAGFYTVRVYCAVCYDKITGAKVEVKATKKAFAKSA